MFYGNIYFSLGCREHQNDSLISFKAWVVSKIIQKTKKNFVQFENVGSVLEKDSLLSCFCSTGLPNINLSWQPYPSHIWSLW